MSAGELLALGGVAGLGYCSWTELRRWRFRQSPVQLVHGAYSEPAVAIVDIVPVKEAKAKGTSHASVVSTHLIY